VRGIDRRSPFDSLCSLRMTPVASYAAPVILTVSSAAAGDKAAVPSTSDHQKIVQECRSRATRDFLIRPSDAAILGIVAVNHIIAFVTCARRSWSCQVRSQGERIPHGLSSAPRDYVKGMVQIVARCEARQSYF